MKKSFTIFTILLLSLIILLSFSCEKDDGKIVLNMYNHRDVTAPEAANWDVILATFAELHPDIELKIEEGFNDPYHQKLQAMAVSGDLPDLVFLWPGKKTGVVTDRGLIKDLRPWLEPHKDEFHLAALVPQGPNGEIYELPETLDVTHVMYSNDRLMKELGLTFPKTFDELLAQGPKILEAGYIPIAMANKNGWQIQSCLLSTLAERAGGREWFDNAVKGDGASFADPEFVNAVNIVKILSDNNMFSPGINQAEYERSVQDFTNQKAVYYIDGGWKTDELQVVLTDKEKEDLTFHAFPDIPDQKGVSGSAAAAAGTGFGMNAKLEGEKAEAAWKWIWFHAGPEGSKIKTELGLFTAYKIPPSDDTDLVVRKLIDYIGNLPEMGPVIDNILDAEGIEEVLHMDIQKMMFGQITPTQVAQNYENWVSRNDSNRK